MLVELILERWGVCQLFWSRDKQRHHILIGTETENAVCCWIILKVSSDLLYFLMGNNTFHFLLWLLQCLHWLSLPYKSILPFSLPWLLCYDCHTFWFCLFINHRSFFLNYAFKIKKNFKENFLIRKKLYIYVCVCVCVRACARI